MCACAYAYVCVSVSVCVGDKVGRHCRSKQTKQNTNKNKKQDMY